MKNASTNLILEELGVRGPWHSVDFNRWASMTPMPSFVKPLLAVSLAKNGWRQGVWIWLIRQMVDAGMVIQEKAEKDDYATMCNGYECWHAVYTLPTGREETGK